MPTDDPTDPAEKMQQVTATQLSPSLVGFKDKYPSLSAEYARLKQRKEDYVADGSFDDRMQEVVDAEWPEDTPFSTDSTTSKFTEFLIRMFSECEDGSMGGDTCRLHNVFAAAVDDLESLHPPEVFDHLLGLTIAISEHGLQTWIIRNQEQFLGQALFDAIAKKWKKFFAMETDKLVTLGGSTEALEFARRYCTSLQAYLRSYGQKSWKEAGATAYKFNFVTIPRKKKRAADSEPSSTNESTPKKAKTSVVEGDPNAPGVSEAAALGAWLDSSDDMTGRTIAMQLRLSTPNKVRHIVVSGTAVLWKLNQFATYAMGLNLPGAPEIHSQKGKTHPEAIIRVTRTGCCTNTIIGSSRSVAAVGAKGTAFVDEKKAKVYMLFRGVNNGVALAQDAIDASMNVELVHPDSPHPVHIELVGVAPRKSVYPRVHNFQMLPRIVVFDDVVLGKDDNYYADDREEADSVEADAINRAWHGDRPCPVQMRMKYIVCVGMSGPPYDWTRHWRKLREPLFTGNGEDLVEKYGWGVTRVYPFGVLQAIRESERTCYG